MSADPAVLAFVQKQLESAERSERAGMEELRRMTMEERGRMIEAVCRLASEQVKASPHGKRMLDWSDPPHPSYAEAIARIRRENPGWVFRMPECAPAGMTRDGGDA